MLEGVLIDGELGHVSTRGCVGRDVSAGVV